MRDLSVSCVVFLIILFLSSCDSNQERLEISTMDVASQEELDRPLTEKSLNTYLFGFDLRSSPQEDARQYAPFLDYLERVTGYRFELRFTSKHMDVVEELGTGNIHFAAIGAGTYLRTESKYGAIPLVRGLNSEGRAEYQSVIVVDVNSPIRKLGDLKDRSFAFGSRFSTQGHIIPRIELAENGIELDDLALFKFTGSHLNCLNEVISGNSDACGVQDTMGRDFARRGLVSIIHTSAYFPSSAIASNRDIAPEVIERVTKALIDFQPSGRDAGELYNWDKTEMPKGFIKAKREDYRELGQWAVKFGIIQE